MLWLSTEKSSFFFMASSISRGLSDGSRFYTMMVLELKGGNDVEYTRHESADRHIKFEAKLFGCARKQIRLKVATISVKVIWSTI